MHHQATYINTCVYVETHKHVTITTQVSELRDSESVLEKLERVEWEWILYKYDIIL